MNTYTCECCEAPFESSVAPHVMLDQTDVLCPSCTLKYEVGGNTGIKVVILEGEVLDWAAYKGYQKDPNWKIAAFGQKLPKNIAEALFPGMVEKGYTYRE